MYYCVFLVTLFTVGAESMLAPAKQPIGPNSVGVVPMTFASQPPPYLPPNGNVAHKSVAKKGGGRQKPALLPNKTLEYNIPTNNSFALLDDLMDENKGLSQSVDGQQQRSANKPRTNERKKAARKLAMVGSRYSRYPPDTPDMHTCGGNNPKYFKNVVGTDQLNIDDGDCCFATRHVCVTLIIGALLLCGNNVPVCKFDSLDIDLGSFCQPSYSNFTGTEQPVHDPTTGLLRYQCDFNGIYKVQSKLFNRAKNVELVCQQDGRDYKYTAKHSCSPDDERNCQVIIDNTTTTFPLNTCANAKP